MVTWLERTPERALYLSVLVISVLVISEITKGVAKLPEGAQRARLEGWLEAELTPRFEGRRLGLDEQTAFRGGRGVWGTAGD